MRCVLCVLSNSVKLTHTFSLFSHAHTHTHKHTHTHTHTDTHICACTHMHTIPVCVVVLVWVSSICLLVCGDSIHLYCTYIDVCSAYNMLLWCEACITEVAILLCSKSRINAKTKLKKTASYRHPCILHVLCVYDPCTINLVPRSLWDSVFLLSTFRPRKL